MVTDPPLRASAGVAWRRRVGGPPRALPDLRERVRHAAAALAAATATATALAVRGLAWFHFLKLDATPLELRQEPPPPPPGPRPAATTTTSGSDAAGGAAGGAGGRDGWVPVGAQAGWRQVAERETTRGHGRQGRWQWQWRRPGRRRHAGRAHQIRKGSVGLRHVDATPRPLTRQPSATRSRRCSNAKRNGPAKGAHPARRGRRRRRWRLGD